MIELMIAGSSTKRYGGLPMTIPPQPPVTPAPPLAAAVGQWSPLTVSVLALLTFVVALGIAFFLKNDTMLNVLVGVAGANATTVVNFWLGSSAGSQKKDEAIARMRSPGA